MSAVVVYTDGNLPKQALRSQAPYRGSKTGTPGDLQDIRGLLASAVLDAFAIYGQEAVWGSLTGSLDRLVELFGCDYATVLEYYRTPGCDGGMVT